MRELIRGARRLAIATVLVAVGLVAIGQAAEAGALATLHAIPRTVPAGSTVRLVGQNYLGADNVDIRLDGRGGRVIASVAPASLGRGVAITIPDDVPGGLHTLVALQSRPNGGVVTGGPGRATVVVTGAARAHRDLAGADPLPVSWPGPGGQSWVGAGSRRAPSGPTAIRLALVLAAGVALAAARLGGRLRRARPLSA